MWDSVPSLLRLSHWTFYNTWSLLSFQCEKRRWEQLLFILQCPCAIPDFHLRNHFLPLDIVCWDHNGRPLVYNLVQPCVRCFLLVSASKRWWRFHCMCPDQIVSDCTTLERSGCQSAALCQGLPSFWFLELVFFSSTFSLILLARLVSVASIPRSSTQAIEDWVVYLWLQRE